MRITEAQRGAALRALREHFGTAARVWLFGSRADDAKRGGDVDLYVEPEGARPGGGLGPELKAGVALEEIFDDGSVDLLVRYPGEPEKPIHRIAKSTGVPL